MFGNRPHKKHIDISFSSVNFIAYFLVFILQLTKKNSISKAEGGRRERGKERKDRVWGPGL